MLIKSQHIRLRAYKLHSELVKHACKKILINNVVIPFIRHVKITNAQQIMNIQTH